MRAAVLLVLALATSAAAQKLTKEDRKLFLDHFSRGRAYAAEHRFEEALGEYTAAFKLRQHRDVQWNMARAQEELGRLDEAIAGFTAYAAMKKVTPAEREEAARRIEALRRLLEQRQNTRLVVVTANDGAHVAVDGTEVGQGRRIALVTTPGPHRLRVVCTGFKPLERDTEVTLGQTTEVQLALEPLPPPEAVLTVETEPSDALVAIGDRPPAPAWTPQTLPPGTYPVTVTAPQRPPRTETVALGPGEHKTLRIALGPQPRTREHPSFAGTWIALAAAPSDRAHLYSRALMTLSDALAGTIEVSRVEPLSGWRQSYCKGQKALEWKALYDVTLKLDGVKATLVLENGRLTGCSCPSYCDIEDEDELPAVALPTREALVGPDVVFVRKERAAGASVAWVPRPTDADLAAEWTLLSGFGPAWHADTLTLASTGGSLAAVYRRGLTGSIYSFQRGKCGGREAFEQVVDYGAPVAATDGGISLRFATETEVSCSCPGACTTPARMGTLELRLLHGGGYLVGPDAVFRRREP